MKLSRLAASVAGGEMQHVFDASLDGIDQTKRSSAFAGTVDRSHHVAHLVSDERLCPPIEDRQQQAIATLARRHGPPAVVDDFNDGLILEQVLAADGTFRRDGGCIPWRRRCRTRASSTPASRGAGCHRATLPR